jgi:hypothetical protein
MTEQNLWIDGPDDLARAPSSGSGRRKGRQSDGFIGCPFSWLKRVLPVTRGAGQLAVALYVYRRTKICRSRTVTVSNAELERELGLSRWTKYRALSSLEDAGVVKLGNKTGRAVKVTLLK